jgi:protein-S-isoprenylcysteine O-methyltransferase Ste14
MHPPFLGMEVLRLAGAALVAAGLASLLESFWRFAHVGLGTPAPLAPPRRLVVSGQYRYVRNPMYVAILAILVGQGLVLGSAVLLQYALVVWLVFHLWVVGYEEPRLRAQFGASYEAYGRSVGRWWPRLQPWSDDPQ